MRIYYAVPSSPHGLIPESKVWHQNLFLPLKDLGHEVIEFSYDYFEINENLNPHNPEHKKFIDKNRPLFSEELLRQVKKAHSKKQINLFFSYFYSSYVSPEVITEIGKLGITTVNWFCNGSYQFNLVSEIAKVFDYSLVPEKFRLKDYKKVGANPIYCQEAANPNFYKPYKLEKEFDVTFVGQKYGNRPIFIKSLQNAKINVHVWGPHWSEASIFTPKNLKGQSLTDLDMVKMYSKSKISLGFTKLWKSLPGEIDKQVRLRDFEATMSGAFYLVEKFDELGEFFKFGKEIETFETSEELVDKCRFYLKNEPAREKICQAGLKRARRDHTWQKRLNDSFTKMKLK